MTDLAAVPSLPPAPTPDDLLAALVEDALFEACTAALDLTAPLAEWHRAGRPPLFGDREPELAVAVHALADRLVQHGPIHAARALGGPGPTRWASTARGPGPAQSPKPAPTAPTAASIRPIAARSRPAEPAPGRSDTCWTASTSKVVNSSNPVIVAIFTPPAHPPTTVFESRLTPPEVTNRRPSR